MENNKGTPRINTGITKLDQLIGGFPKGRTILLTGDAGTGKTIFGLQFAQASSKAGLKTCYIATEEGSADLQAQAGSFGWDIIESVKNGTLTFIELSASRAQEIETAINMNISMSKGNFENLLEHIPKGTQVIIVDSLGSHSADLNPRSFKDRLDLLVHKLNSMNTTALLMIDSATSKEYNDMALFSVYGAIVVMKRENPYTGRRERVMDVVKMRNTSTPIQLLSFEITPTGIALIMTDEGELGKRGQEPAIVARRTRQ